MTGCPIGFNAHLSYIRDWGKFVSRMQPLQPRVMVGFIDNDNDMSRVQALKMALPRTLVIGRAYVKNGMEGQFHLKPEAPGDMRQYIASPDDVVNRWGAMGKSGMSLNALNEPGTADADKITRLVAWTNAILHYGYTTATSLTVLNLATGHPGTQADQWDTRFDEVLNALSRYRDLHILGLHEYLPEAGRIGRFKAMLKRCSVLGIQPPRVAITEFGVDSGTGEQVNGYRSRGWSGADYAGRLIELVERVYRPALDGGTLLGLCVFSYGNSGEWGNYDVESDQDFFDRLLAWKYVPVSPPAPQSPPVVAPVPPINANGYARIAELLRSLAVEFEALSKTT